MLFRSFTNLEFRSNLEQFLIADGDCNVVVIGHIDCYGIRRAKELSRVPVTVDGDGGQICYIDDWLAPLVQLLKPNPVTEISDGEVSNLNIRAQVEKLKDIITERGGGVGSHGIVTIVGLFFDDTVPGRKPTQLVVKKVNRRE